MPDEIELKFPVDQPAALRRRLRDAGFRVSRTRSREQNWLFDDARGSLRTAGKLLRLRRTGKQWLLTAKGPRQEARPPFAGRPPVGQAEAGLRFPATGARPAQGAGELPRPGVLKRRREAQTVVADGPACRQALSMTGLRESGRYALWRTLLRRPEEAGEIAWDETPFGVYLEIEGTAGWVRKTAAELGLKPADAERRSYPELFSTARRPKGRT